MIYSLNRTVLKAIASLLFITIQYYKSFKNPANIKELNINGFRRYFIPKQILFSRACKLNLRARVANKN